MKLQLPPLKLQLRHRTIALGVLLSVVPGLEARADYRFTKIADTSGPFSGLSTPAINNEGAIAFTANLYSGGSGVFKSDGGSLQKIADSTSFSNLNGYALFSAPAINDNGTVVFSAGRASLEGGSLSTGLYTSDGTRLNTIFEGRKGYDSFSPPLINNKGLVAVNGRQPSIGNSIFVFDSTEPSINPKTIAASSGSYALFYSFSLNDNGLVAFQSSLDNTHDGLFVSNGGSPQNITETQSSSFQFLVGSAVNDKGAVTFRAGLPDQISERIVIAQDGAFTTVAEASTQKTGKPFISFNGIPLINNAGDVAFEATQAGGKEGIFIGPDPVADKVIAIGDPLFGSTVKGVSISQKALNDSGQMVLDIQLANGTQAIVRAEPNVGQQGGSN